VAHADTNGHRNLYLLPLEDYRAAVHEVRRVLRDAVRP
jgi:hypothetical protein